MPLTLPFILLVPAIALVVFLAVSKGRGMRWGFLAGGLAFLSMAFLFVVALSFLISPM